jgi:hypothetical protein
VFELHAEVHGHQADGGRNDERDGSEVEDAVNPGRDDLIGDPLCIVGGDGENRKLDAKLRRRAGELVQRLDGQAGIGLADLLRIIVEQGRDLEASAAEPAILQQGAAEVSHADHRRRPRAVDAEDAAESVEKLVDVIADAGMAELTEKRQILADLGIVDRQGGTEAAAGDRRLALSLGGLKLADVETDSTDNGLGRQLVRRGLASRGRHEVACSWRVDAHRAS